MGCSSAARPADNPDGSRTVVRMEMPRGKLARRGLAWALEKETAFCTILRTLTTHLCLTSNYTRNSPGGTYLSAECNRFRLQSEKILI